MSDGLILTPAGDIVITTSGRQVLDTSGNLVMGLPAANDYGSIASPQTVTVTFPDFTKDWLYNGRYKCHYNGGGQYTLSERGDAFISALPQEWSATTILTAAPTGANFFAAKVRINRTTAPANTWNGQTMGVKPVQNKWITYSGSMLLEAEIYMSRSFSLYLDSGNLVLHQQQSISTGPGYVANTVVDNTAASMGYGTLPIAPGGGAPPTQQDAGEWSYGSTVGNAVFANATTTTSYNETPTAGTAPALLGRCSRTTGNAFVGSLAASVTDTTNYSSIYTVDIAGKFCRAT